MKRRRVKKIKEGLEARSLQFPDPYSQAPEVQIKNKGGRPRGHLLIEKAELISDAELEELARAIPKIIPKQDGKRQQGYAGLNQRLAKMKQLNVLNWIVLTGKMRGMSDQAIAEKLGCCTDTVARHKRKIQKSEWLETVTSDLMDLEPLFRESLKVLALKADAYTTVKFYEGIGGFKPRQEVTVKVDKDEQIKRFADQIEKVLGVNIPKSRLVPSEN